jgi:hypothetical protein
MTRMSKSVEVFLSTISNRPESPLSNGLTGGSHELTGYNLSVTERQ